MSEREEYTPSMDAVRNRYARIMKTDGTLALTIRRQKEFDRWLAAHDRALREQIADDLQTEAENLDLEVPNAHREGMREGLLRAADIARGEEQTDE